MTVADSISAMPDLHRSLEANMAHDENLAKQKHALDVALLCSKLEAFRREQDRDRVRREKRDAVRNGSFVLRAPPKQLAATATQVAGQSEQPSAKWKHQSASIELGPQHISVNSVTTTWIERQQSSSKAPILNTCSSSKCDKQEKRDSLSPPAKERMPKRQTAHNACPSGAAGKDRPQPPRRLSSRTDQNRGNRDMKPDDERGRVRHAKSTEQRMSEYRPGDAAKRRTENIGSSFPLSTELDRALDFSNLHDLRFGRLEHEVQIPSSILQEWDSRPAKTAASRLRVKLAVHDRPNWCQQSQNGDSPRLRATEKKQAARFMQVPVEASNVTEGHLVADAVEIIKRQEKIQKRRSMLSLGLFKK